MPADGGAKCIKVAGVPILKQHKARIRINLEFRPKGTDNSNANATLYFSAGFPLSRASRGKDPLARCAGHARPAQADDSLGVGVKQLKARLSEYVRLVKAGETILVMDRDQVVAKLRPARRQRRTGDDLEEILQSLADRGDLTRITSTSLAMSASPRANEPNTMARATPGPPCRVRARSFR